MHWTFQRFDQVLYILVARPQTRIERKRRDHKALLPLRFATLSKTHAE